jgi:hypothetical protein
MRGYHDKDIGRGKAWARALSKPIGIHRADDVTQIEIHTAEPSVPDPGSFEVDTAIAKLKRYKSPGSDQIPAELDRTGGETLRFEVHELINSTWSKEELPDQWKEYIILTVNKGSAKIGCSRYRRI